MQSSPDVMNFRGQEKTFDASISSIEQIKNKWIMSLQYRLLHAVLNQQ